MCARPLGVVVVPVPVSIGVAQVRADEALEAAVRLSHRYISGRQLPDKAVSVLDTACAKVALGQSATPARIDEARKHLERLEAELVALQREVATGARHGDRLDELTQKRQAIEAGLKSDEQRWSHEQQLVQDILALRTQLEASPGGLASERELLAGKQAELVVEGLTVRFEILGRAPQWVQRVSMEWLWRLLSDPRRLAKRYLIDSWAFVRIALTEHRLTVKESR